MANEIADVFIRLFVILAIVSGFFFIFCFCAYKCNKNRMQIINRYTGTPIAVTQITTTTGGNPPYPINPLHPTPQSVPAPTLGFVPVEGYQTAPYPPVPAPVGMAPRGAPYPPMDTPYPPTPYPPSQAAPPPSYNEAVGQTPVQPPPVTEQYAKQSPYNPNY